MVQGLSGLWLMYGVKQCMLPVFRLLFVAPGAGADCSRQRQEDFAVGLYSRVVGIRVEVLGFRVNTTCQDD